VVKLRSPKSHNCRLAFVIPAFKGKFLASTLTSLAEQTNQNFSVYIGDDASPDNLMQIIAPYRGRLKLYYHRFDDNIGETSLVKQWERSVALSSEQFFCLFGDDDVLHRNCVANFYAALKDSNEQYDVYRFNNAVIDEQGELIAYTAVPNRPETHTAFLSARLHHRRISFISSYVIRRDAYLRENGFVEFPLAWFSDDASIIQFSRRSDIGNITGDPVYWRLSNQNISAPNESTYLKKIEAAIKFLQWIADEFGQNTLEGHLWKSKEFKTTIELWFFRHIDVAGCYPITINKLISFSATINAYCRSNAVTLFFKLYRHTRRKHRLRRMGDSERISP
jgi:glycosyltransferase involved in cell wall biosynthesis